MVKALFTLLISVLILQGAHAAKSIHDVKFCETNLAGRLFSEGELAGPHLIKTSNPTVIVKSQQQNYDGTHQFVLKRKGGQWSSAHIPEDAPNAAAGNPLNFAIIMGGPLAHYFGFSVIDDKQILVPSVGSLNKKIEEMNLKLLASGEKPIGSRFYFTSAAVEEGALYNREFASRSAFPISEDPIIFIHDLSFHLGAIALPFEFTNSAQKITAVVNLFAEELKAELPKVTGKRKTIYNWTYPLLIENETNLIDLMFGNAIGIYSRSLGRPAPKASSDDSDDWDEDDMSYIVQGAIGDFFSEKRRKTIRAVVQSRFRYMLREVMFWSENPEEQFEDAEILSLLDERLDRFAKKNPQIDWDVELPNFSAYEVFIETTKRVKLMQAIIKEP